MTQTMCSESVRAGTAGWRTSYKRCSRAATVERNGKPYCGQHDPEAITSRRQAKSAEWDAAHERKAARYRLEAAAPDLLAALKCFLDDSRFQVGIGGNPIAVDRMIDAARAAIAKAEGVNES